MQTKSTSQSLRNRKSGRFVSVILGMLLAGGLSSTLSRGVVTPVDAHAAQPEVPTCGWASTSHPNADTSYQIYYGVTAVSPTDVWAVGSSQLSGQSAQSIISHWDGTQWSLVPSPSPGTASEFKAVEAVSANDVWAVGWYWADNHYQNTFIAHWDGTSWTQANSPNHVSVNGLDDIEVISANDIWAVGGYGIAPGQGGPLAMHWDGVAWTLVPTPNGSQGSALLWSVTATSTNDVWAVGDENVPVGGYTQDRTFTLHWDGTAWTYVPSPNIGDKSNQLYAVDAVASNDVWAAGTWYNHADVTWYPLFEHWDGNEWKVVEGPNAGPRSNFVNGITAVASDDVWAVGLDFSRNPRGVLLHHWDGLRWNLVNAPQPTGHNDAWDITHTSANDIWYIGKNYHYEGLRRDVLLAGNYTGACGTPGPTYTPTSHSTHTPAPTATVAATHSVVPTSTGTVVHSTATATHPHPTSTAAQPTETHPHPTSTIAHPTATHSHPTSTATTAATAEPTACAMQFSDITQGQAFYENIMCLACSGMISGYSDGSFRPGAQITRGQLAKIVSNAAGFDDPVSSQSFGDVAPGSTFYEFIERLAARDIISGYGDGTFRSNASATRGQISKIVANAAGISGPLGEQRFEDVLPGSPFYEGVQLLANHGVMSGYACGATGEPCGTQSRPYFRPHSNATRGQVSKIVANAFFPGCATR